VLAIGEVGFDNVLKEIERLGVCGGRGGGCHIIYGNK
jgi:hypothetical protein